MASGLPGPAGVFVRCPVEVVPGREQEFAQTHHQNMADTNVKGTMCRLTFATVTLALVSAFGTGTMGQMGICYRQLFIFMWCQATDFTMPLVVIMPW